MTDWTVAALARHARKHSPYYRRLYAGVDFSVDDALLAAHLPVVDAAGFWAANHPSRNELLTAPHGDGIVIRVSDDGPGLDEATLARAFDPYFSTKMSGTGLGLPIARRNIELHGGHVSISSRPGAGTTVTLTLPR